jgi:hypothetical protein
MARVGSDATVTYEFDAPDSELITSSITLVVEDGTERRWALVGMPAGELQRWLAGPLEGLLDRQPVRWGTVGRYVAGDRRMGSYWDGDRRRDLFSTPLGLRVVPVGSRVKLELVHLDEPDRSIEERRRLESVAPTFLDREAFVRALLAAARTHAGRREYEPRTSRLLANAESMLATTLEDGRLSGLPYTRSMGAVRGTLTAPSACRDSYACDERLDRYLLLSDALPALLSELRGHPDAPELYRRLFVHPSEPVRRLALDLLAVSPDPAADHGVALAVWGRSAALAPPALRVLGRLGTPLATDVVLGHVDDPEAGLAVAAVGAAAGFEGAAAREALERAEADERPAVRAAAAALDAGE